MDLSATTLIDRPAPEVFDYVMDVPHDAEWRTGVVEAGFTAEPPVGVGTTGFDRVEANGRSMTAEWTVFEHEPGKLARWTLDTGPISGTGGYVCESVGDATRFTIEANVRPTGGYRILGPVFGTIGRRQNQTDVETLRRLLERTGNGSPAGTAERHDVTNELERLIDQELQKKAIRNVALAIHSPSRNVHAVAAGGLANARDGTPMSTTTPYYLASITKMYTAAAVMILVREGIVSLADPLSAHLQAHLIRSLHTNEGVDRTSEVTLGHLLNQTSGLPDYFDGKTRGKASLAADLKNGHDRAVDITDIVEIARELPAAFAPGTGRKAFYSDTNYALLGAIIRRVTGEPLAAAFQRMIFDPLGLDQTFVFDQTRSQPRPADMYYKRRNLDIPLALSSFPADGGIVSTLEDSLTFLKGFFSGPLLSEEQVTFMTSQWRPIFFPLQYGHGVMRYQPPRWMSPLAAQPQLLGHSGSTGSFAFYSPERDLYMVGTVNQMHGPSRPYRLMSQVLKLLD